jgi:hypothetical protein
MLSAKPVGLTFFRPRTLRAKRTPSHTSQLNHCRPQHKRLSAAYSRFGHYESQELSMPRSLQNGEVRWISLDPPMRRVSMTVPAAGAAGPKLTRLLRGSKLTRVLRGCPWRWSQPRRRVLSIGSCQGIDFSRAEKIVARPVPRCRRLKRRPKVGATEKKISFRALRFAQAFGREERKAGTTVWHDGSRCPDTKPRDRRDVFSFIPDWGTARVSPCVPRLIPSWRA